MCSDMIKWFKHWDLPSPPAPSPSLCPTPAATPSPCPPASSAPPLSSTRTVRSDAPDVTAALHAVGERSPVAGFCCGGSRFPVGKKEQKTEPGLQVTALALTHSCTSVELGRAFTLMSMVLDWDGMDDSCCRRPWVTLRLCFRVSFSADRHSARFSESVAPWKENTARDWWNTVAFVQTCAKILKWEYDICIIIYF